MRSARAGLIWFSETGWLCLPQPSMIGHRTTQSITPPFGTDKEVQDNDSKTTHDPEANACVNEG
jgi:hypothetical protein